MASPDQDGHEEINMDSIANLTIKDGELYWQRQKLKTETQQKLVLSLPQKLGALFLSLSVSIAAILTPIGQYVADMDKICPNTSYSAPYCESWKIRHDKEAESLLQQKATASSGQEKKAISPPITPSSPSQEPSSPATEAPKPTLPKKHP